MVDSAPMVDMLKPGTTHLSGRHVAVLSNIEAVVGLGKITRTSMGPSSAKKLIVNHLKKISVSSDSSTIVRELDLAHPAAKLVTLAMEMQQQEMGDGSNLVLVFCAQLLANAEKLIVRGLHTSDVIAGYERGGAVALRELHKLVSWRVEDLKVQEDVARAMTSALGAKQFGYEDMLSDLVARACIQVLPENPRNFNVDNVRVAKILGGGVLDTRVLKGHVLARGVEGTVKHAEDARVAVFAAGIDSVKTETKDTVVLKTADALLNYTKSEEAEVEAFVGKLHAMGVKVAVSGSAVGELALHFLERHGIMVVRVPSKFELRRVVKTVGAQALARFEVPTEDQLGHVDECVVDEIGSTTVTIFRQVQDASRISTIVLRASTQNLLDDFERAIDDGVNVYKAMCKDASFVPGAGAAEIELAARIQQIGDKTAGLTQHSIRAFGEAFEVVPQVLAENAGLKVTDVLADLYRCHQDTSATAAAAAGDGDDDDDDDDDEPKPAPTESQAVGINVVEGSVGQTGIVDSALIKANAIRLATEAAATILRIDQLIMARTAGGPTLPQMGPRDA